MLHQELLASKEYFLNLIWRICQNRQYRQIFRFSWLFGLCPKPSIHSNSSSPVLFLNMPVPVQRFWLTCLSKKKIGVWLEGESTGRIFPGRRETFFQVEEWANFWLVSTLLPSRSRRKTLGVDPTYLVWWYTYCIGS